MSYPKYDSKFSKYSKKKKASLYDRLVNLFKNIRRIIKIANKPSRKEYWTVAKIILVGLVILGGLFYVIQLLFTVLLRLGRE